MEDLSALEKLLKSGEFLQSLQMERKTADLVFDSRTLKAIYELVSRYRVDYIDYPISSGKESIVFKAYLNGKAVALKIYKMSTLRFSNIWKYIDGDYRFSKEHLTRSSLVYLWARKEFTNLSECRRYRINAPKPIAFHKNLLMMSYLGTKSRGAPMLKDADVDFGKTFEGIMDSVKRLYGQAKLVHADLSEYNVLIYRAKPYLLDMAQSVSREHPAADFFLERDVKNICNFFRKKGGECNWEDSLREIRQSGNSGKA